MRMSISFCVLLFIFVLCSSTWAENVPRGAAPMEADRYAKKDTFTCRDGSETLPYSAINDDYCDCKDGSDEPGTSACLNGHFFCFNSGYKSKLITSSRVDDSLCDCCDGSDEQAGKCPNTCEELGKTARVEADIALKAYTEGIEKRASLLAAAAPKVETLQSELAEKQTAADEAIAAFKAKEEELKALEEEEKAEIERRKASWTDADEEAIQKKAEKEAEAKEEKKEEKLDKEEALEAAFPYPAEYMAPQAGQDIELNEDEIPMREEEELDEETQKILDEQQRIEEAREKYLKENAGKGPTLDSYLQDIIDKKNAGKKHLGPEDRPKSAFKETPERAARREQARIKTEERKKAMKEAKEAAMAKIKRQSDWENEKEIEEKEKAKKAKQEALAKELAQMDAEDAEDEDALAPIPKERPEDFKLPAANDARRELSDLKQKKHKAEAALRDKKKIAEADYGPDKQFMYMVNECFSLEQRQYTYEVCPFGEAIQKEGNSRTKLGKYEGLLDDKKLAEHGYASGSTVMSFERGDKCWNGPARSLRVDLSCGAETLLSALDEPSRCVYTVKMTTPALCTAERKQALEADIEKKFSVGGVVENAHLAPYLTHDEL